MFVMALPLGSASVGPGFSARIYSLDYINPMSFLINVQVFCTGCGVGDATIALLDQTMTPLGPPAVLVTDLSVSLPVGLPAGAPLSMANITQLNVMLTTVAAPAINVSLFGAIFTLLPPIA